RRRLRELAAIAQQVMRPSARLSLGTCATPAAARAEAPPLGGRSLHANFLRSADRSPVAPLHAHRSPVHVRSRRAQVEHRWHHGRPAASPAPRARGDDAGTAAGPRRTHRVRGGACPGGRGALPEASGRTSEQKARRQRPGGAGPDGGRAFRAELLRAGSATYQMHPPLPPASAGLPPASAIGADVSFRWPSALRRHPPKQGCPLLHPRKAKHDQEAKI
ncbi:unnamed protein product, partial [Prorocentrum cordatum]